MGIEFFTTIHMPFWNLYIDNKVDGEAIYALTERALELLMPIIGDRMKFLKKLNRLKEGQQETINAVVPVFPSAVALDDQVIEIGLREVEKKTDVAEQVPVNR